MEIAEMTTSTIEDGAELTFNASVNHETTVDYYEARLYRPHETEAVLDRLNLGKPVARNAGPISINIAAWLSAHPPGEYVVRVAAVGALGSNESRQSNRFAVQADTDGPIPPYLFDLIKTEMIQRGYRLEETVEQTRLFRPDGSVAMTVTHPKAANGDRR